MNKETIDKIYYNDEIKAQIKDPNVKEEVKISRLQNAIEYYAERCAELEVMPAKIDKILREQEEAQSITWGSDTADRLRHVVEHFRSVAASALAGSERFRDDMLAYLRAMSLCLEMTGNAQTHSEKNARLRGAIEVIERAIESLRNERFDFSRSYWRWPDPFKSDFPTRELMRSLHQTKDELKEAREEIARLTEQPSSEATATAALSQNVE
jgi:DNA repair exonuclease SbcCD ATPase subunit